MTIGTHLLNRSTSPLNAIRTAAVAALFALASAALADPPAPPAVETRSAKVSLAGLDLATPAGARAALERLKIAAQHLCWELGDVRKISYQATYNACVNETLTDAVRRVNAPTLAALEK